MNQKIRGNFGTASSLVQKLTGFYQTKVWLNKRYKDIELSRITPRVVQTKTFFFKYNPSPPHIVWLVIETHIPNFSSFGPQGEEGMQFEILKFRRKNILIFCPLQH